MVNLMNIKTYEEITNFKKTVFGIRKKEVFEYINMLNENLSKAKEVFEEKLTELRSANELLAHEKNRGDEAYRELERSHKALLAQLNSMQEDIDYQKQISDELEALKIENDKLKEDNIALAALSEENRELKKKNAECEAVNMLREQHQAELNAEIDTLRTNNKEMLANFLEERARLLSDINEKNLHLTQLLKMHSFTLSQSRDALETLLKQFDESCKIASEIKVD